MRYRRSAALLVSLAALPAVVPAAHADPPAGAGAGKVVPFVNGGGVSADDVLIDGFTPGYTGESVPDCKLLGHGKVLAGQPDSVCTIKPGSQVLVPLPGATCSDAEAPPFFAATAAEQRACALAFVREQVNQVILSDRFLNISPQFHVVSQPDNPFGANPGPTSVVAAGYQGVLRGLPPGRHTFVTSGNAFGGPFTLRWTVDVVP
jgi:hypothetical protein